MPLYRKATPADRLAPVPAPAPVAVSAPVKRLAKKAAAKKPGATESKFGRPRVDDDLRLRNFPLRLNGPQRRKTESQGGQRWVRSLIDQAKVPKA